MKSYPFVSRMSWRWNEHNNNKRKRRLKRFRNYVQFVVSVCTNIKRTTVFNIIVIPQLEQISNILSYDLTNFISILNIANLISTLLFHYFPAFSLILFAENKMIKSFERMLDRIYFNLEMILSHNLLRLCIMKYLIEFDDKPVRKFYNKYNSLE